MDRQIGRRQKQTFRDRVISCVGKTWIEFVHQPCRCLHHNNFETRRLKLTKQQNVNFPPLTFGSCGKTPEVNNKMTSAGRCSKPWIIIVFCTHLSLIVDVYVFFHFILFIKCVTFVTFECGLDQTAEHEPRYLQDEHQNWRVCVFVCVRARLFPT